MVPQVEPPVRALSLYHFETILTGQETYTFTENGKSVIILIIKNHNELLTNH